MYWKKNTWLFIILTFIISLFSPSLSSRFEQQKNQLNHYKESCSWSKRVIVDLRAIVELFERETLRSH